MTLEVSTQAKSKANQREIKKTWNDFKKLLKVAVRKEYVLFSTSTKINNKKNSNV